MLKEKLHHFYPRLGDNLVPFATIMKYIIIKGVAMKNLETLSYQELLEEFKKILKANALKFTTQREAILATLYENPQHFTSENLYLLVKQKYPKLNMGIATVYRTLTLLEENGLVSSISLGVQGKKFEIANKPHHDHLICSQCGKIVEFENEQIEALQKKVAKENGFLLTDHLMQLYGICSECQ
jgi:Fur family ferric uptake transcriptional regulator